MAFRLGSAAGGRIPQLLVYQRSYHCVRSVRPSQLPVTCRRTLYIELKSQPLSPGFSQAGPGEINQVLPDLSTFPSTDVGLLSPVSDSVSTLAEAGLGASWSPISLAQHGYFELHSTLGLPWWATVILGVACVRLMLLPAQLWALKTATRIHNHLPEELEIQRNMVQASQDRDQVAAVKHYDELMELYKQHNIAPMKPLRSAAVNLPITVTAIFSLLEMTMAHPPLAGMTSGGLFWFSNLAASDPYYIMPVCCSLMTVANVSIGAETGLKPVAKVRKYVWTVMPVGVVLVAACVPASLQLYWMTNMALSMLVSRLVKTELVRALVGAPAWQSHPSAVMVRAEGAGVSSFVNDFRQAVRTAEAVNMRRDKELLRSQWAAKLDQNQRHHEQLVAAARVGKLDDLNHRMHMGRIQDRGRREDLEETELQQDEMEKPYMKRRGARTGPPRTKAPGR